MEDGLVPSEENYLGAMSQCLNPCCSGRWSRTLSEQISLQCINPYCSGQWSRTLTTAYQAVKLPSVLILVVMEDGLVLAADLLEDKLE